MQQSAQHSAQPPVSKPKQAQQAARQPSGQSAQPPVEATASGGFQPACTPRTLEQLRQLEQQLDNTTAGFHSLSGEHEPSKPPVHGKDVQYLNHTALLAVVQQLDSFWQQGLVRWAGSACRCCASSCMPCT
jgi:hypothetical protein